MPKAFCMTGLVIAALILVLFVLDLATGFPFMGASPLLDISFAVCGLLLAYLSWSTLRELR